MVDSPTSVLLVEDESRLLKVYESQLEDNYEVLTAMTGEEALDLLDESVDVVLLDRHMPGLSGDEVLERLRDRGFEIPVAMLTGVDPDFDIVDMDFDDYVVKPVNKSELQGLVESLTARKRHDEAIREYFAVVSKIGALEAEKGSDALEESEEYDQLMARLAEVKEEAREALDEMLLSEEFETVMDHVISE